MRKLLILLGLIVLIAGPACAQDYPKAEISGDYMYIRINPGGGASGANCHGVGGSVAGNLNDWFGVVGDFGGCRVSGLPSGVSSHAYTYLFGPRVSYRNTSPLTPYAQVLFGGERATASVSGVGSSSNNAFAMSLGGGADYSVNEHIAIRVIQVEYLYTHFGGARQNNARIEAGIVFRFGGR
jgi:opacity protein-like surface antigen